MRKYRRQLARQRGLSKLSWIALLLVIGFAATVVFRVVPAYFEYYIVVRTAESVRTDPSLKGVPLASVRQALRERMQINDVDDLGYDVIDIKLADGGVELLIDYEVREDLIGNVDVVMEFKRKVGP